MSDLKLDVDQASELKAAFRRGNWTNAEIKKICEGNVLAQFREVILGQAEIVTVNHVIDCDADPFCPDDWKVVEHKKGGQFQWDPAKVLLYLSEETQEHGHIEGNKLHKELADKHVLNANVLDHLLAHPELIPEEWKDGRAIFFLGTIYCGSLDGYLLVRCLRYSNDHWSWGHHCLINDFSSISLAAVHAS
jgi:hypothetical protein